MVFNVDGAMKEFVKNLSATVLQHLEAQVRTFRNLLRLSSWVFRSHH